MEKYKYKLSFTLDSLRKNEAVISIKRSYPINRTWTQKTVELSKKLCSMLKNNPNKYNGIVFESTNQDPKWINNPYKLICYKPKGKSDIPEHYRLEMVNEMEDKAVIKFHADGTKYTEWKRRELHPTLYKRYRTAFNTGMMVDLHEKVRNAIKSPTVVLITT